jgi:F-type H+-transporting ATPase subunit delta
MFCLWCASQKEQYSPAATKNHYVTVTSSATDHRIIADRYVSALFPLAEEANAHDVTLSELNDLADAFASNNELKSLAENPTYSREQKAAAMEAVLKKSKASGLMLRFVRQLTLNNRLESLPAITENYKARLAKHRNEIHVDIHSARELSQAEIKKLTDAIGKDAKQTIVPHVTIKPELIAGVIIRAESKMLDYSAAGRLKQLAANLKTTTLTQPT